MSAAAASTPAAPAPAKGGGIGRRSARMAVLSLGGVAVQRAMGLLANLVMARLLLPEAFGLMALVTTVLTMAEMVSDIGVRQSIVRDERGEELRFLQIAWTVQVLRSGAILVLVLLAAAGLWAFGPALAAPGSVYADPVLPALVAAASLAVILRGLSSTAVWRAHRRMEIGRVTAMEIGAQAVTLVAMLGLAWTLGATVWVLLGGFLIGTAAQAVMSHLLFRDAPMRPAWDPEVTGEMWRFGRWIILSSSATFAANSGDRFVMGALLDADTFGLYAIATIWLQVGVMLVDRISGTVVLSALAEGLRTARAGFDRLLGRMRLAFDAALALCALAAIVLAGPVIALLYPPVYAGAAPILMVMALRFLALQQRPLQQVLTIEGRTDLAAAATVLAAVATFAGVPLAWHLAGLEGALIAAALAPLAGGPVTLWAARRLRPGLPVARDLIAWAAIAAAAWALHAALGPALALL